MSPPAATIAAMAYGGAGRISGGACRLRPACARGGGGRRGAGDCRDHATRGAATAGRRSCSSGCAGQSLPWSPTCWAAKTACGGPWTSSRSTPSPTRIEALIAQHTPQNWFDRLQIGRPTKRRQQVSRQDGQDRSQPAGRAPGARRRPGGAAAGDPMAASSARRALTGGVLVIAGSRRRNCATATLCPLVALDPTRLAVLADAESAAGPAVARRAADQDARGGRAGRRSGGLDRGQHRLAGRRRLLSPGGLAAGQGEWTW